MWIQFISNRMHAFELAFCVLILQSNHNLTWLITGNGQTVVPVVPAVSRRCSVLSRLHTSPQVGRVTRSCIVLLIRAVQISDYSYVYSFNEIKRQATKQLILWPCFLGHHVASFIVHLLLVSHNAVCHFVDKCSKSYSTASWFWYCWLGFWPVKTVSHLT